jgi:hypothetical protein
MFKILDSDNDTEAGHMRSGKVFRGVHLENLFKQNYGEEGFYNGEEANLTNKEHPKPTIIEEGEAEELRQSETEILRSTQTTEVSNVNPPIVSTIPSSQNSENHQSFQSTVTSSPASTQKRTLVIFMEDEMRLPIFRGDGSEDLDEHWFLCEVVWNIKSIIDEAIKRT